MAAKSKADPLVAAATILIEGVAFEQGTKVTGVSEEELARAVSARRVVPLSVYEARGVPAPELGGEEPEADVDADADAGADAATATEGNGA